jgi:hypothetical protein
MTGQGNGNGEGGQWIAALREQLEHRSQTMSAALEDVAEWCGASPAVGWLDVREDPKLTVYVVGLGSGVLYRIEGKRDPVLDPTNLDGERKAECSCSASRITTEYQFSLSVITKWRGYHDTKGTIARRWAFRTDHGTLALEITYPPLEPGYPEGPDPRPFARALANEITRVQVIGNGV